QHWDPAPYLAWKRERVTDALSKRGLNFDVSETVSAWGAGRRRAAFHAARQDGRVRVGFVERGGARLMPISMCPVLTPGLEAMALKLGAVADLFLPVRGEITLQCLETESGVDVAVKGAGRADALGRATFEAAVGVCETLDLARLSVDGEPIVTR